MEYLDFEKELNEIFNVALLPVHQYKKEKAFFKCWPLLGTYRPVIIKIKDEQFHK